MTPRKASELVLQPLLFGPSSTISRSSTKPCHSPLPITLALMATLLLIILISASHASAQNTLSGTSANSQASPPAPRSQRRPNRWKQPAPQVTPQVTPPDTPKPTDLSPAAIPTPLAPTPGPTVATTPQRADEPLPFMADTANETQQQPPSAGGLLVRTLGALLLIVGLIVAAAWGIKRFGGARFGTPLENAPSLAVINSLSLGERRSLTIVRFGSRTLLLGSTSNSVTLLAEAETDDFEPPVRSVADILKDEDPAVFSQELFSATEHLNEKLEQRRGHHFTA